MQRFFYLLLTGLLTHAGLKAQIPQVGKSQTLEIACWNVEWFGSTQNGPYNETLQYTNVKNVLVESNIDIWALEEISDTAKTRKLINETGIYDVVFADYWQTQKTALVWRKSLFNFLSKNMILGSNAADFANGRLPLEVKLCTKNLLDTFTILVIHLKAQTGSDKEKRDAWFNRQKSAGHLQTYLQQNAGEKIVIAGDWNDDIDLSIYNDTISPFLNLLNNATLHFLFKERSAAGEHSYLFASGMIDHILVNDRMFQQYQAHSAEIFYLQNAVNDYGNTTSDHYPIFAKFSFTQQTGFAENQETSKVKIWPNPVTNGRLNVESNGENGTWELLDMYGKPVANGLLTAEKQNITITNAGHYVLILRINNIVYYERLVVKG